MVGAKSLREVDIFSQALHACARQNVLVHGESVRLSCRQADTLEGDAQARRLRLGWLSDDKASLGDVLGGGD